MSCEETLPGPSTAEDMLSPFGYLFLLECGEAREVPGKCQEEAQ